MNRIKWTLALALMAAAGVGEVSAAKLPTMGYHLDISRSKVPTMKTLRRIVDVISSLGYNQFQLYTEHTFAYSQHETVWREASPMTPAEVRELDAYCAAKGVELVPNQNSFGHLELWLKHPEYNVLAECPTGGTSYKPWGYTSAKSLALCPTDPRSVTFLAGIYDELFPCFRSKLVNVGCDETIELLDDHEPYRGRSAAAVKAKGPHRVYVEFLNKIHALLAARGHTMMFWGDIILHHPELIDELPKDVICLDWGYEAKHPFDKECAAFAKAGRRFYVCPGASTWNTLTGRLTNMMANIDNALAAGEKHGAEGVLLTDWGDTGHSHPWLLSLPALVYTSHRRNGEAVDRAFLAAELDKICGCKCGRSLVRLGDVYLKTKGKVDYTAELDAVLRQGKDYKPSKQATKETLREAMKEWRAAREEADLTGAPDWVRDGYAMFDLLEEAVNVRIENPNLPNFRALFEPRFRAIWLRHNRVGGLERALNSTFGLN